MSINNSTNISKWILIVFITLFLSSIILYWWAWNVFSVKGTSTCFYHRFVLEEQASIQLINNFKNILQQKNFIFEDDGHGNYGWQDRKITFVSFYLNTTATDEHQLSVCTPDKKSKDWQYITVLLENFLPENIKQISSNVSLDPEAFGLTPNCRDIAQKGRVGISLPITLEKLNISDADCKVQIDKKTDSRTR